MSKFRKRRSGSFNRPANTTQYAANDLVAGNAVAANVAAVEIAAARFPGGNGTVTAITVTKTDPSVLDAAFRVHLFQSAPSVTNGDNGAFAVANGRAKGYLGAVDVTIDQALGDGAQGRASCDMIFDTTKPGASLFALVEALDTYTPASGETFTITLELERD